MSDRNPLLAAFAEAVDRRYLPAEPESFWLCESLFRHLLDPQFVESVINAALGAMTANVAPTACQRRHSMILARAPAWTLSLHLLRRPRRDIRSAVAHALVAPVGGAPLTLDRYELPADFRDSIFDPAQKLCCAGTTVLPAGEPLAVRAGGTIFDARIETPSLILMLETAPLGVLECRFSRDTLHAWSFADADPAISDLKAAAWLAGRLAHQTSLKPLKALSRHADPGVRWVAVQSVGRLSRSEGRRLLVEALGDRHPQLRRSARHALDRDDDPRDGGRRWR